MACALLVRPEQLRPHELRPGRDGAGAEPEVIRRCSTEWYVDASLADADVIPLAADVDGDGRDDVVLVTRSSGSPGKVYLYRGGPAGFTRASLGDANVFPAASSMFMSFDKDILALYVRGNDSGGRCFATTTGANLDGDAVTLDLAWQNGTCGAPITAHYPFILLSLSRTAADGSSWITPTRSVCGAAPGVFDSRACATLSGASPAPTVSASASPSAATTGSAPTATPSSAATRTLTPSAPATSPVAAASPTPGSTSAQASAVPSRSPAAAASPASTGADAGTNYLLYGMLIAIGVLIGIALMLSRSSARRGR